MQLSNVRIFQKEVHTHGVRKLGVRRGARRGRYKLMGPEADEIRHPP